MNVLEQLKQEFLNEESIINSNWKACENLADQFKEVWRVERDYIKRTIHLSCPERNICLIVLQVLDDGEIRILGTNVNSVLVTSLYRGFNLTGFIHRVCKANGIKL